jgi:hypothetical protein
LKKSLAQLYAWQLLIAAWCIPFVGIVFLWVSSMMQLKAKWFEVVRAVICIYLSLILSSVVYAAEQSFWIPEHFWETPIKPELESAKSNENILIVADLEKIAPTNEHAVGDENLFEILRKSHSEVGARLNEAFAAGSQRYPIISDSKGIHNLTVFSYSLEKNYPGFCNLLDNRTRNIFLNNPNEIRFSEGGVLRFIERNCRTRIYYDAKKEFIYIITNSNRAPPVKVTISEDFIFERLAILLNSTEFIAIADKLARNIAKDR